ncbi:hypothetical protein FACS189414_4480 [Bacteroidia bacterium]|nr:hypothetical protein AGMMS49574_27940 [Bacteroidia bacterium]GHU77367.1 hypothetical protein FACS189414_4480 [Bacteroidia bacterium]GHV03795.1 hypothetical protein FACS189416_0800 [Bacteroidia bacterium]
MLNIKLSIAVFITFLLISAQAIAQKGAEISSDLQTYDFGVITESEEPATHIFTIKNTGTSPLVINRITASCGCTQPEWSKAPIAPGATGEVKVSYNPKGRPGPFYKNIAINSNAKTNRLTLYIKGTVATRSAAVAQPVISYPYNIGDLKLQTKSILYSRIYPGETGEETIHIKNEGKASLSVRTDKLPNYLTVDVSPQTLKPGDTGEISLMLKADNVKRMGHISVHVPLIVESDGKKKTENDLEVSANIIDNFTHISSAEKAKAPVAQYSLTLLDFGKLPEKSSSIIPFIGGLGKESESLTITNTGQSTLLIYSVSCDNELIDISGGKKELKQGASSEYKISIRPKEVKAKLEAYITIVSNDPNGPVRLIKVTAEK